MSARMTSADFELFQKFQAFMAMTSAPSDTVGAVAADVAPTTNGATVKATASEPTTHDVTVTVATAGGYGITGADGVLYSVGRANREARGKIFSGFKVGDTLLVTLTGKHVSAARLLDADKIATVKATAERVAESANGRKNGTTRPPCTLCHDTAHPHEGMAFLVCLARQYTRETGLQVRMSEGYGAEFLAFAQWFAAAPRVAYAANSDGCKPYGGTGAAIAAPSAPAVKAPAAMPNALQVPSLKTRDHCLACRKFCKSGEQYHDKCRPATGTAPVVVNGKRPSEIDPAVLAAMAGETVHIDALDDESVVQETVKTPDKMSQKDIATMSGWFDVEISKFKGEQKDGSHSDQEGDERPLIQIRSADFVTSAGAGRWVRCADRNIWATLRNKPVGFAFTIKLGEGSIILKAGRKPSAVPAAPVETNPQGTVSAAAAKRAATRRAKKGHQDAAVAQRLTQTNAPTVATNCPKCDKRFSMVGTGQRGMCAICAPKSQSKAS
jgi:hypothetical protein